MKNGPTIKAVTSSRQRKAPTTKAVPLTAEKKKEKKRAHDENAKALAADIDEWFSATMAKAEELAEKYNKKTRYILDHFFHGGARLVHERPGASSWNAFLSKKNDEVNGGTSVLAFVNYNCSSVLR